MSIEGIYEGDVCNRNGCSGHIEAHEVEGCSCHISAPCNRCIQPREYCSECDWSALEEQHSE